MDERMACRPRCAGRTRRSRGGRIFTRRSLGRPKKCPACCGYFAAARRPTARALVRAALLAAGVLRADGRLLVVDGAAGRLVVLRRPGAGAGAVAPPPCALATFRPLAVLAAGFARACAGGDVKTDRAAGLATSFGRGFFSPDRSDRASNSKPVEPSGLRTR